MKYHPCFKFLVHPKYPLQIDVKNNSVIGLPWLSLKPSISISQLKDKVYDWLPSLIEVLFTLLGTTYGGDGINTFAVPDLRPKDGSGNVISLTVGQTYNGKPYMKSFIALEGVYPGTQSMYWFSEYRLLEYYIL